MAEGQFRSTHLTSKFDIPYLNLSSLNTLDLHFPTDPAPDSQESGLWLIYIHGGAFRDPNVTSRSVLPTLPFLFDPTSAYHQPSISGVASINYRLSPYPDHALKPSEPGDPARSSEWPDYLDDVKAGIQWVLNHGDGERTLQAKDGARQRQYILAGHSVGGTMAMMIAQSNDETFPTPVAIVSLCGIYNFATLRDAHMEHRAIYDAFTTAAFGPEEGGGWERGNCTRRKVRDEVKVVLMGHGKKDNLVDWGQCEEMSSVLDEINQGDEMRRGNRKAAVVEVGGDHDDIWKEGREFARCIETTVGLLREVGE